MSEREGGERERERERERESGREGKEHLRIYTSMSKCVPDLCVRVCIHIVQCVGVKGLKGQIVSGGNRVVHVHCTCGLSQVPSLKCVLMWK